MHLTISLIDLSLRHFFQWHKTATLSQFHAIMKKIEVGTVMVEINLHEDLEYFASYLGVDYDDYYQLVYHLPDEDVVEVEHYSNLNV